MPISGDSLKRAISVASGPGSPTSSAGRDRYPLRRSAESTARSTSRPPMRATAVRAPNVRSTARENRYSLKTYESATNTTMAVACAFKILHDSLDLLWRGEGM